MTGNGKHTTYKNGDFGDGQITRGYLMTIAGFPQIQNCDRVKPVLNPGWWIDQWPKSVDELL